MKSFLLIILAAGVSAGTTVGQAQTILLKDGNTVQTLGLTRPDAGSLAAKIKTPSGAEGQVGYPLANIARVEFPDPPQRKIVTDLLTQNKAEEALRQLTPILAYYSPFRDVPGSWWTALAFLQVDALSRLGRDGEMQAVINDLTKLGAANPEILRAVKIRQGISLERKGDHAGAARALEPIVADEDASPQSLADAWVNLGAAKLAQREYRTALLAYLHIPVYTPERTNLMPTALLGSGAAYVGLNDKDRAESTFKDLIARFPNSPEAADAKGRLKKLNVAEAAKSASNG